MRGLLIVAADGDGAGIGDQRVGLVLIAHLKRLTGGPVDVCPSQNGKVHKPLAEQQVSLQLPIVAHTRLDLQSVHIGGIFGNDIDHAGECHAAIQRRSRPPQHLDLLHLFQADAEIRGYRIGGIAVEPVTVQHDEDLFLPGSIYATHGNVHLFIALDMRHAGHVGGKHFLEVTRTAHVNHLLRNQRHGDRRLLNGFRLLRCRGNGSCLAGLDSFHHLGKTGNIIVNPVVRIHGQKLCNPRLRHFRLVHIQVAEGQKPVHANEGFPLETVHRAAQEGIGLLEHAELVRLLGLLEQVYILLCPDCP